MPVLVPETPVTGDVFVTAELRPTALSISSLSSGELRHRSADREYIASLAGWFFTRHTAIAEVRNGADAGVQRNALLR